MTSADLPTLGPVTSYLGLIRATDSSGERRRKRGIATLIPFVFFVSFVFFVVSIFPALLVRGPQRTRAGRLFSSSSRRTGTPAATSAPKARIRIASVTGSDSCSDFLKSSA